MFASTLAYVTTYGSNVPYIDDWAIVPYVAGEAQVTVSYLWEQHNEHRIPVPKLLLLTLFKLTGGDFRAGMYFNVIVLAALAFFLLRLVHRLRGRTIYSDAIFPVLLLQWGHYETILWSWAVQLIFSTMLITILLGFLVGGEARLTGRRRMGFGVCLVLLPLCGSQGLPFALTLAGWLGYVGVQRWRNAGAGGWYVGAPMVALAATAMALIGLYYLGYERHPGSYFSVPNPTLPALMRTALECLSTALGSSAQTVWPFGAVVVVLIGLLTSGLLASVVYARPAERTRALGLLVFLAAVAGLALGVGWGRAGDADEGTLGFEPRYATLMVPAFCAVYLIWDLYGSPLAARLARMGLFALACSVWMLNSAEAVKFARVRWGWEHNFLRALTEGEPLYQVSRMYARPLTYELNQVEFAGRLEMLHRGRIGPYRALKVNPPFVEEPLPIVPAAVSKGVSWKGETARMPGPDAYLDFVLPQPRYVAGIRLTVRYLDLPNVNLRLPQAWKNDLLSETCPRLQLNWKTEEQAKYVEVPWWEYTKARFQEERYLSPDPREQTITIWVADTIDQVRIYPDNPLRCPTAKERYARRPPHQPYSFSISEMVLLSPEG
jgi:hypothetical protein